MSKFLLFFVIFKINAPFKIVSSAFLEREKFGFNLEVNQTKDWLGRDIRIPFILPKFSSINNLFRCALTLDTGYSAFNFLLSEENNLSQNQLKKFAFDLVVLRVNYGCLDALEELTGYLRSCVGGRADKVRYNREYLILFQQTIQNLRRFPVVQYCDSFSFLSQQEEICLKYFCLSNAKPEMQEELWNHLIKSVNFSNKTSNKGVEILPVLKKIDWLADLEIFRYPICLKICLQEDAREMIELYCGVRFSPEFAGSPEPLEDILVPGIFEKIEIAATGVLESTQATAAAALDCVLSLFSKKSTAVETAPEAQAFLGKKKQ